MGGGHSKARPNEAAAAYPELHRDMAYIKSFEEYKKMYDESVKASVVEGPRRTPF